MIDYRALREEQKEKRARGEYMGIGISSFTEVVGAGNSRDFDILGINMFDSAEIQFIRRARRSPDSGRSLGQATRRRTPRSSQRNSAFRPQTSRSKSGDTDTAPYGLGTYASPPTAGAAAAMAARKIKAKARKIAAPARGMVRWPGVERGPLAVQGVTGSAQDDPGHRVAAYTNHPTQDGGRSSRRRITTIAQQAFPSALHRGRSTSTRGPAMTVRRFVPSMTAVTSSIR